MRLFLIADLYSTIVAVIVVIAFFDRFKKYKTIPDSQNLAEGKKKFFLLFHLIN